MKEYASIRLAGLYIRRTSVRLSSMLMASPTSATWQRNGEIKKSCVSNNPIFAHAPLSVAIFFVFPAMGRWNGIDYFLGFQTGLGVSFLCQPVILVSASLKGSHPRGVCSLWDFCAINAMNSGYAPSVSRSPAAISPISALFPPGSAQVVVDSASAWPNRRLNQPPYPRLSP